MKRKRGARVAQARQSAGLSQHALAARIGTTRSTIARIEAGDHSPSVDLALALSRQLGESVEALFGGGR
jgi:DNA-binding XRE family transcriptional regulator